ncbi:MAG: IS5 family transposase, partial [Bacteroidales bacterium]|nr:IS5 family transposase [Bacteroidales bacterium]
SLFEQENTMESLSKMGNPLVVLKDIIDFEQFRSILESLFANDHKKSSAGRKPIDPVFMLKVLFLQRLYNISDHQIEYQIKDRMSFREFLDIQSVDDVPDEKTVWKYRDIMSESGVGERLFAKFNEQLASMGLIVNEGKIVDASFVIVPKQRNTREENKKIKEGKGNELWNDNPHKKCHKDIDARWTKKGGVNYYGYKDHTVVIEKTKIIRNFVVTPASVHDSTPVGILIEGDNNEGEFCWFDSAYVGTEEMVKSKGLTPLIIEKGYRYKSLTEEQKENNRVKSKTRCRIEHVYVFMEQSMKGLFFRGVGILRAVFYIGFTNLVYNMCRLVQIKKYHPEWIIG